MAPVLMIEGLPIEPRHGQAKVKLLSDSPASSLRTPELSAQPVSYFPVSFELGLSSAFKSPSAY
jgi:hypothetical protein